MMVPIKTSLGLIRHVFITKITYRWDIFVAIAGNIFYLIVSYFLWKAAFSSKPLLVGYNFKEFFLYITAGWCYRYLIWGNKIDRLLARNIYSGNISMILTRPLELLHYFSSIAIGTTTFIFVFAGLPVFIICSLYLNLPISFSPLALLSIFAITGAFMMSVLLNLIIGMIAISTVAFNGIAHMKDLMVELLSGMIIPITMFPGIVQGLLKWLPLPYMASFPIRLILGQISKGELLPHFGMQLMWIALLYILYKIMYFMLRKKIVIWKG